MYMIIYIYAIVHSTAVLSSLKYEVDATNTKTDTVAMQPTQ